MSLLMSPAMRSQAGMVKQTLSLLFGWWLAAVAFIDQLLCWGVRCYPTLSVRRSNSLLCSFWPKQHLTVARLAEPYPGLGSFPTCSMICSCYCTVASEYPAQRSWWPARSAQPRGTAGYNRGSLPSHAITHSKTWSQYTDECTTKS